MKRDHPDKLKLATPPRRGIKKTLEYRKNSPLRRGADKVGGVVKTDSFFLLLLYMMDFKMNGFVFKEIIEPYIVETSKRL